MLRALLQEVHVRKIDGNGYRTCVNKIEEVNQVGIQTQKVWSHQRHDRAAVRWAVVFAANGELLKTLC